MCFIRPVHAAFPAIYKLIYCTLGCKSWESVITQEIKWLYSCIICVRISPASHMWNCSCENWERPERSILEDVKWFLVSLPLFSRERKVNASPPSDCGNILEKYLYLHPAPAAPNVILKHVRWDTFKKWQMCSGKRSPTCSRWSTHAGYCTLQSMYSSFTLWLNKKNQHSSGIKLV